MIWSRIAHSISSQVSSLSSASPCPLLFFPLLSLLTASASLHIPIPVSRSLHLESRTVEEIGRVRGGSVRRQYDGIDEGISKVPDAVPAAGGRFVDPPEGID
eukprot:453083-Hanusia_phi.AAC.1